MISFAKASAAHLFEPVPKPVQADFPRGAAPPDMSPAPSFSPLQTPSRSLARASDSFDTPDINESLFDGTFPTPSTDHAALPRPSRLGSLRPVSARRRTFRQLFLGSAPGDDGVSNSTLLASCPEVFAPHQFHCARCLKSQDEGSDA